jgi:Arc/MetJ-type ribon-helix-helix transcriptional regulator
MKKKINFEKVSVSLPPEVHEWIKAEAARRADRFGEHWSASRIVQEALREYRSRASSTAPMGQAMPDFSRLNENQNPTTPRPHLGGEILTPHNRPAGGSKTPKTVTYRKAGRAGK